MPRLPQGSHRPARLRRTRRDLTSNGTVRDARAKDRIERKACVFTPFPNQRASSLHNRCRGTMTALGVMGVTTPAEWLTKGRVGALLTLGVAPSRSPPFRPSGCRSGNRLTAPTDNLLKQQRQLSTKDGPAPRSAPAFLVRRTTLLEIVPHKGPLCATGLSFMYVEDYDAGCGSDEFDDWHSLRGGRVYRNSAFIGGFYNFQW